MMVRLDRIYTKTGDAGTTALGDGIRVPKTNLRVEAYGTVDELNSVIGLATLHCTGAIKVLLRSVGNDLFDVGADLCVPPSDKPYAKKALRIVPAQVARLEGLIDTYNAKLKPLNSFTLPGGTPAASWCHLGRTVCRRAERRVAALMEKETVNPDVMRYLNRLSDLLYVLTRFINGRGNHDVLWVPGQNARPR